MSKKKRVQPSLKPFPKVNQASGMTSGDCSAEHLKELVTSPITVTQEELEVYRNSATVELVEMELTDLLANCRKEVISNIVGPLGLGQLVAQYDKLGGNVTTVHNAKKDIYAQDSEKYDRGDYTGSGTGYTKASKEYRDSQIDENFDVFDQYCNKKIYYKNENGRSSVDCDHIVSCHEYHQTGGFIQTDEQKSEFATDSGNFATTQSSINSSLGDSDKIEWAKKPNSKDPSKTNAEYYELDQKALEDAYKRGKETAAKHAPTTMDWAGYYTERLIVTGVNEAAKFGLQQAFGFLLCDLSNAFFDELIDCKVNGFTNKSREESLVEAFKQRLLRVGNRVIGNWKILLKTFRDGFFSGFFSNLLTTFINTFATTLKNVVRIIREGTFVLLKAGKAYFFPEEKMSREEAAAAALKIFVAGAMSVGGIALHEAISKLFAVTPFPGRDTLIQIGVGVVVGVATAVVLYGIDKWDPFGAKDAKKRNALEDKIKTDWERLQAEHDSYVAEMRKVLGLA